VFSSEYTRFFLDISGATLAGIWHVYTTRQDVQDMLICSSGVPTGIGELAKSEFLWSAANGGISWPMAN
jgi:hypothetical protein